MAYNVRLGGLSVSCDSPDEVLRLNALLEKNKPERNPRSIKDTVAGMGERPRQLLKVLLETDTPVPKSALGKRMGLKGEQLSGVITGISKPVSAAGFKPLLLSTIPNGNGAERQYSLDSDVVEDVREALGMK